MSLGGRRSVVIGSAVFRRLFECRHRAFELIDEEASRPRSRGTHETDLNARDDSTRGVPHRHSGSTGRAVPTRTVWPAPAENVIEAGAVSGDPPGSVGESPPPRAPRARSAVIQSGARCGRTASLLLAAAEDRLGGLAQRASYRAIDAHGTSGV